MCTGIPLSICLDVANLHLWQVLAIQCLVGVDLPQPNWAPSTLGIVALEVSQR